MIDLNSLPPVLLQIAKAIQHDGGHCVLVGGWVRDFLLGEESKDYDLEVYGMSESALKSVLKKYGRPNSVGRAFGVITLAVKGERFDFAFPRTENKTGAGHRGFVVETHENLDFEKASLRRDFTINAMGVQLPEGDLLDPNDGQRDLGLRVLRHVSDAFGEDPLRALRAVQFAARFELSMTESTKKICAEQDLSELSRERFYEEFRKLLMKGKRPSLGFILLKECELLRFFPELDLPEHQWGILLKTMDEACRQGWAFDEKLEESLKFSLLISELSGKDQVVHFLNRILDDKKIYSKCLQWFEFKNVIVGDHDFLSKFNKGTARRLALKMPCEQIYWLSWIRSIGSDIELKSQLDFFKKTCKQAGVWKSEFAPILTGKILKEIGLQPGPNMGKLISESYELQMDDQLTNLDEIVNWVGQQIK